MLKPITALILAGNILQIAKIKYSIASAAQLLLAISDSEYVTKLRAEVRNANNIVTKISPYIVDDVHEIGLEEHQAILTTYLQSKNTGYQVSTHLDDVSKWEKAKASRMLKSFGVTHAVAQTKFEPEYIQQYVEILENLVQVLSPHITTALENAAPAEFAVTSLKLETLQAGLSTVLRLLKYGVQGIDKSDLVEDGPAQQCVDIAVQVRLDSLHCLDNEPHSKALSDTRVRREIILNLINFRQMSDRIEEVEIAFKSTLEWIFRDNEYKLAWSSFPDFLTSNTDLPYWINGKAGSGKSTLLRFLIKHPKTLEYLHKWSNTQRLNIFHFFAWNLGSTLQKSQLGLLKSFMYQALAKDTSLVHKVFPDLWHDIDPSPFQETRPVVFD